MRKTSPAKKPKARKHSVRKEYRFDYSRAKPNRVVDKFTNDSIAVILEPDVAARFKSSKTTNGTLRSFLSAMPEANQDTR